MRYISVPISNEAMQRLDLNQCIEGDLIELILSDKEYNDLWESEVFTKININLSKNIDEYEDESIINIFELENCKLIITECIKSSNQKILTELLTQVDNAIKHNTGIFFFF